MVSQHDLQYVFSKLSLTVIVESPGRFYASLAMKMVLSGILSEFDIRLENQQARTRWFWETFAMPYESTRVVFKRLR